MKVDLLYYTPAYHKLAELNARKCYDSVDKCGEDTHKLVPGIMNKGHLSIAQHGNIVFGVTFDRQSGGFSFHSSVAEFEAFLIAAKEENNFIRWTRKSLKKNPESKWDYLVSGNILTFIQSYDPLNETGVFEAWEAFKNAFRKQAIKLVNNVPELRWFYDRTVGLEPSENPYLDTKATLLNPAVLVSDYEALRAAGLNEYELGVHATITVEIVSDRAMSLQDARHKDMFARSEISQRYVDFKDFDYRVPNGIDPDEYIEVQGVRGVHGFSLTYHEMMDMVRAFYGSIQRHQEAKGETKLRAKEQARSVLSNATLSRYIDTRPLRQWKHYFGLRDEVHAQNEKQDDARALKKAFGKEGVLV